MLFPEALYTPSPGDIARNPPQFVIRRAIQPGSAAAAQTITVWEGDSSKHLILSSITLRVSVTANAAAETRLDIARLELLDSGGTLATIVWEVINTPSLATEGIKPDGWNVPLVRALGSAAVSAAFNIPCVGMLVPGGTSLRFVLGTGGGVPVNLSGVAHLVGLAVPLAGILR